MANRKLQINGDGTCTLPSAVVDNEACSATSGKEIDLTKQRHLKYVGCDFGIAVGGTPTTTTKLVYRAKAAGTIRNFTALLNESGSSSSMTFDLKKATAASNSYTSVLSAAVTVANATGDNTAVAGTISSATYVAGDLFEVVLTVSTSTGAQGPWCDIEFDETAS